MYLHGVDLDQPAMRQAKEFIEGLVATDYDGRTIIELLQNSHDAHDPNRSDGHIEFHFAADEADHGVLYAANGGRPLATDDFKSMCRVAMSSKRPDQGIGNKGVGFKSVWQISASPEIYSRSAESSVRFDGYCFRFARHEDFDTVAGRVSPGRAGFADELRDNVTALQVPIGLTIVHETVERFLAQGAATVIRIPLRSEKARDRVVKQLAELCFSDVPFHLFLKRVATIGVRITGTDCADTDRTLTRRTVRLSAADAFTVDQVTVDDDPYLVVTRIVAEQTMLDAIARSRSEDALNSGWERWEGDAEVSIALPFGGTLTSGRLYTFLPMAETAAAPLAGFVNAPFFARLDRRTLDETVSLNDTLLTEVATLAAEGLTLACSGLVDLPEEALIDLACWRPPSLPRLRGQLEALGGDLASLPLLPAIGAGHGRTSLQDGRLWRSLGKVANGVLAAKSGVADLVSTSLDPAREQRILAVADSMSIPLRPAPTQVAELVTVCAASLADSSAKAAVWADFYDDIAGLALDASLFQGLPILIGQDGELIASDDDDGDVPTVFFGRTPGEEGQGTLEDLPGAVRGRLRFMSAAVPWLGEGRKARPGRKWLEQLVREYRTEAVLDLVGRGMRETAALPGSDADLRVALQFAFRIWSGARRETGEEAVSGARLLLPTVTGWKRATETYFGKSWSGSTGTTDDLLVRLLDGSAAKSQQLKRIADGLLQNPRDVFGDMDGELDLDECRRFVELVGARHGLMPLTFPAASFKTTGYVVANPTSAPHFPVSVDADTQEEWLSLADGWSATTPAHSGVEYTPTTGMSILPGQLDWPRFDETSKQVYAELVLRGLDVWPDAALEVRFTRKASDNLGAMWPTFVSSFIAWKEWLPQTTPRQRTTVTTMSIGRAWWVHDEETPPYVRAQPPKLRLLMTARVMPRLIRLGLRVWDDPSTASDRLDELGSWVEQFEGQSRSQTSLAVRKAYEAAWKDVTESGQTPGSTIVVAKRGRLALADLLDDDEVVYIPDEAGVQQERLLNQAPVLTLPLRDRKLAQAVQAVLESRGVSTLRRMSEAVIEVAAGDARVNGSTGDTLEELGAKWIEPLLLGVMEFHHRVFPPATPTQLAAASDKLQRARFIVADDIRITVDGHDLGETATVRSFLVAADGQDVVAVASGKGQGLWGLLEASSPALAQLVGLPTLADSIRLAVLDLQRATGSDGEPSLELVARALDIPTGDLTSLMAERSVAVRDLSAVIAVLACIDITAAEELRDLESPFETRADLESWLSDRVAVGGVSPQAVLELADTGSLLETVTSLGVELAQANAGLRAVGVPTLANVSGHERQLTAYLQRTRNVLMNRLRDRFVDVADNEDWLREYVRLRELPGLVPDSTWLDRYWDVPDDLLATVVDAWIAASTPTPMPPQPVLPDVDELREQGRRTVNRVVPRSRVLVEAWLHRHRSGDGSRPDEAASVAAAITAEGRMDFRPLTAPDVLAWFARNGQWPEGMPASSNQSALSLSGTDLEQARERLERGREQRRRETSFVAFGDRTYSGDPSDLAALRDAVRENLSDELLDTPFEPLSLAAAGEGPPVSPSGGGTGAPWRASSVPSGKLNGIGVAAEVVVGEWIARQFGLSPEATWVSGFRSDLLGDGKGSDKLGYDYIVEQPERTLLIEVKASVDDNAQFSLGESEVRRAGDLKAHEQYVVAYVINVLNPDDQRILLLPNPMASGGLRRYHVRGTALRLEFELEEE
jgi:hypothetical protein